MTTIVQMELYSASCNPPRRAKRPRTDADSPDSDSPVSPPAELPTSVRRTSTDGRPGSDAGDAATSSSQSEPIVPAKRGRKPGPLSRAAREAQRKLNHSIIEKARRTKINDALATLRELVPADYGQSKHKKGADDHDDGYDEGPKVPNKSKTGKKEEKEKEFKLEILIRTVSFMQDLLQRVSVLEATAQGCDKCAGKTSHKRKWDEIDDQAPSHARLSSGPIERLPPRPRLENLEPRLPSISSWLPEIDPRLLSPTHSTHHGSHLPSPPSSTRFDPVKSSQLPPALNLGPVASYTRMSPVRTPEDESAASLLLQISVSPPSASTSASTSAHAHDAAKRDRGRHRTESHPSMVKAQTPGALLGLHR